jgi:hypothetical protein
MDPNNESHSKIEFENEESHIQAPTFEEPTPKIVLWVMKVSGGRIKEEERAGQLLIVVMAIIIIISLFVMFSSGNSKTNIKNRELKPAVY